LEYIRGKQTSKDAVESMFNFASLVNLTIYMLICKKSVTGSNCFVDKATGGHYH